MSIPNAISPSCFPLTRRANTLVQWPSVAHLLDGSHPLMFEKKKNTYKLTQLGPKVLSLVLFRFDPWAYFIPCRCLVPQTSSPLGALVLQQLPGLHLASTSPVLPWHVFPIVNAVGKYRKMLEEKDQMLGKILS